MNTSILRSDAKIIVHFMRKHCGISYFCNLIKACWTLSIFWFYFFHEYYGCFWKCTIELNCQHKVQFEVATSKGAFTKTASFSFYVAINIYRSISVNK